MNIELELEMHKANHRDSLNRIQALLERLEKLGGI